MGIIALILGILSLILFFLKVGTTYTIAALILSIGLAITELIYNKEKYNKICSIISFIFAIITTILVIVDIFILKEPTKEKNSIVSEKVFNLSNTNYTNNISNTTKYEIGESTLTEGLSSSKIYDSTIYNIENPFVNQHVTLTLTNVNPEYISNKNGDSSIPLNELVASVSFNFKNTSDKDLEINPMNFKATNNDNVILNRYYPQGSEVNGTATLKPGDEKSVTLYYKIPSDLKNFKITFDFYPMINIEPIFDINL